MTGSPSDLDDLIRVSDDDPVPASWFDAVNDNINWLNRDRPACRLENSGAVAVANATWTAVTFDTEDYDTAGLHSTSANTSRITIPTGGAGRYSMGGNVRWTGSAAGSRGLAIRINGSAANELCQVYESAAGSNPVDGSGGSGAGAFIAGSKIDMMRSVHSQFRLAVGDYIELYVFQSSGGSLNIVQDDKFSPSFYCQWEAR